MFSSNNILTNILDPDQAQQHIKPTLVLHEVLHKAHVVTTSFKMSNKSIRFDLGRKKKNISTESADNIASNKNVKIKIKKIERGKNNPKIQSRVLTVHV